MGAWAVAALAVRSAEPRGRAWLTWLLPLLAIADLMAAHWYDSPTVDPSYWTKPPPSAQWIKRRPDLIRIYGEGTLASGEPGYASKRVNFLAVRELLAWSLPPVWDLRSTGGETPIRPTRWLRFTGGGSRAQLDVQSLTYIITGEYAHRRLGPGVKVGHVYIHPNPSALPRARLVGQPVYARSEVEATIALRRLDLAMRDRLVVEDPDRPLPEGSAVSGTAAIVREEPDRVEIAVDAQTPAYLFLADAYDPGWSATIDGRPATVRPAQVAFRAVFVPKGKHSVVFRYRPAGLMAGLAISGVGLLAAVVLLLGPFQATPLSSGHGRSDWPRSWPWWLGAALLAIVALSLFKPGPEGGIVPQKRWAQSLHRFTWGAGIEAMNQHRRRPGPG